MIEKILSDMPKNKTIMDNFIIAYSKINSDLYHSPVCSVSGGADSDIMLDICTKCDKDKKISYVWFDTGLEYQATKDHLKFLEEKYNITIEHCKAAKPIPTTCKTYGQPFLSKHVSDMMERLQRHNFQWEDESFEALSQKYPKCLGALKWWCCAWGEGSHFNITQNKYLKEFILSNPPTFKISKKCCQYAKKDVIHKYITSNNHDLNIYGVRKAEGGIRSVAYKNCFTENEGECDDYRPLFWYMNEDKEDYENYYGVTHSDCYTKYGLKRTGCAGCPFNRNFEEELDIIKTYEPKLFKAVNNIFGDSYEYTRKYKEFCKKQSQIES